MYLQHFLHMEVNIMVVQHNLTAMNSNRMLGLTTASQAKSTEKLSSGYKINRAADDAAGLSISEKMRKQIRGLTQASLNAQDGISAVQTAEGALTEVHDMLQRMNELAVKASNGTNSEDDRGYIQDEIDQLVKEIDRVSETTKFNETYLLKGDGTATREVTKTTPAQEAVDVKAEYVSGKGVDNVALKNGKTLAANAVWYEKGKTTAITADDIDKLFEVKNGNVVLKEGVELFDAAADSATDFGAQLTANKVDNTAVQGVFEVGSSKVSTANDGSALVDAAGLNALFNTDGSIKTKFYAQKTDGSWAEVGAEQVAKFIKVTPGQEAVAAGTKTETETYTKALTLSLHVGADGNDDNKISLDIESMSAEGIGVKGLDVSTEDAATKSIETLKASIQKVSTQRSALGAIQNRLEHTINNLDNVVENTTSAESQIRDTDMATEMVKYSNNNILAQAGQAMLAQSNQANQGVLSLLQ
jgi:flagellin